MIVLLLGKAHCDALIFVWHWSSEMRWGKSPSEDLALQLVLSDMKKELSLLISYINCLEQQRTITVRDITVNCSGSVNHFWTILYSLCLLLMYIYIKREWLEWSYWCRRARQQKMRDQLWFLSNAADRNGVGLDYCYFSWSSALAQSRLPTP